MRLPLAAVLWPLLPLLALLALAPPLRADEYEDLRAEFRKGMKSDNWKVRGDAFLYIGDYDRAETVADILTALRREENAAVVLRGVETLASLTSPGSQKVLFDAARRAKGRDRLLVLSALGRQGGKAVGELLGEIAAGRDGPAAAQAALALRGERRPELAPMLVKLLKSKAWQVRRAAAITLGAWKEDVALKGLAAAFKTATGRDRRDLIEALESISGESFGNDPAAWSKLAKGEAAETIQAKPIEVPTVFGEPIYGQRVAIVLDNSQRMENPHPFDADRLRALCDPQDGNPIPWFRMKTNAAFAIGHVKHLLMGLPKKSKVALVPFNAQVRDVFPGFASVGSSSRRTAFEALDSLTPGYGIASYDALSYALDIAGRGEAKAWKSGPDEIVFVTVNMPKTGEIEEADVVAAAIALKAGLRMVPIHTIGIDRHPYEMCRTIAEKTGGTYVALTE